ncbi:glycoside hydrolase family 28 protein [Klebsiella sp. RHBSTW-00484]|uniref:glycosyl hydrolase family 28 protein n=1 Tax=unclassified Klebsiella TaxID=2608929 RepID=UPI0015E4E875|nr:MULTISPECIES: glycoside hydrolase family 28 protein [unclassified Klebsiella]MBA7845893.1 glycoside hydrolase family 28 protein [Klebsiella sp. RHBSTW-00465]QLO38172.1 glycoside hydrolase family 28 protein [Klebsiella sp. RHBSTW-00484]QLT77692.1 glycoside hydrolase family 28 protein [Klebsiella sp. RHBSTW-00464]
MRNSFKPSRCMLALTLALAGVASGCNDNSGANDNHQDAPASAPQNVMVPILSADENSLVLVWEKPESETEQVVDYVIYRDGERLGSARDNQNHYSPAKPYIDNFYQRVASDGWQQQIDLRTYTVGGLKPDTEYEFTVRAVYAEGKESPDSAVIKARTSKTPHIIEAKTFGAKDDGTTLNTQALQQAIDSCTVAQYPQGCKVVISGGEFKTGALFLHSDMTLEIVAGTTLLGSEDPAQYPLEKGYYLYPYSDHPQPRRPPSLINVLESNDKGESPAGTFRNIRIVGKGTIDGNGWTRGVKNGGEATITDELGNELPQYRASNAKKVSTDGILAKNQTEEAIGEGVESNSAYKNRRSSLMTLRGVQNLYLAGLTIRNPAFHGVMALESENITLNGLIHQTFDGNNADGVEFGNSQNALVFNNFFDTGDDCVNFAAGFGKGAETFHQKPQSGAWIFNNYFRKGHGAVVTGSHTGAWIEKVRAEDNVMYMTDVGLRMKSRPYYGGGVREVLFRNNAMQDIAKEPFVFTIKYSADVNDTTPADEPAQFRDVQVQNITVDGTSAKNSILVDGMTIAEMAESFGLTYSRDAYHQNLRFSNVKFRNTKATSISFLHDSQFDEVTFANTPQAWEFFAVNDVTLADSLHQQTITSGENDKVTLEGATK